MLTVWRSYRLHLRSKHGDFQSIGDRMMLREGESGLRCGVRFFFLRESRRMVGVAFMTPVYLLVDWRHKCHSYHEY